MKKVRLTTDIWETQGNYGMGWEAVTYDETAKEGRQSLKDYRDNEPQYVFRLLKKRERKTCQWFALCENDAKVLVPHPILGKVPTCSGCADKNVRLT